MFYHLNRVWAIFGLLTLLSGSIFGSSFGLLVLSSEIYRAWKIKRWTSSIPHDVIVAFYRADKAHRFYTANQTIPSIEKFFVQQFGGTIDRPAVAVFVKPLVLPRPDLSHAKIVGRAERQQDGYYWFVGYGMEHMDATDDKKLAYVVFVGSLVPNKPEIIDYAIDFLESPEGKIDLSRQHGLFQVWPDGRFERSSAQVSFSELNAYLRSEPRGFSIFDLESMSNEERESKPSAFEK